MQWIGIEDGLPEIEEGCVKKDVLVCYHNPDTLKYETTNAYWNGDAFEQEIFEFIDRDEAGTIYRFFTRDFEDTVTHWMYYPEPVGNSLETEIWN